MHAENLPPTAFLAYFGIKNKEALAKRQLLCVHPDILHAVYANVKFGLGFCLRCVIYEYVLKLSDSALSIFIFSLIYRFNCIYNSLCHYICCKCSCHIYISGNISDGCCIDGIAICQCSYRADASGIGTACHRCDLAHL